MRARAVTLVAASQVLFVALLATCVALLPGLVLKRDEGGVSNYGVHATTAVPYAAAYVLDAGLLAWAARLLDAPRARRLRRVLDALAILLVATALSTIDYTRVTALRRVHDTAGAVLVLFEVALCEWLARQRPSPLAHALVAVAYAGLVLCALASFAVWHVLFAGEILVTAGLAPLLVRATGALAD
jgi:hypothetical protein